MAEELLKKMFFGREIGFQYSVERLELLSTDFIDERA